MYATLDRICLLHPQGTNTLYSPLSRPCLFYQNRTVSLLYRPGITSSYWYPTGRKQDLPYLHETSSVHLDQIGCGFCYSRWQFKRSNDKRDSNRQNGHPIVHKTRQLPSWTKDNDQCNGRSRPKYKQRGTWMDHHATGFNTHLWPSYKAWRGRSLSRYLHMLHLYVCQSSTSTFFLLLLVWTGKFKITVILCKWLNIVV